MKEDESKKKKRLPKPFYYETVNHLLKDFTGYELRQLNSGENLIKFLHEPRDGSSLAVARILFGFLMMIDIVEERSGSELDYRWGDDLICRFTLFPFIQPMSLPRMAILYGVMWLGALGISVGYKFTCSCLMYVVPYWYLIVIDKSVWNNHSYLFGLIGILFTCSSANSCLSLDSHFRRKTQYDVSRRRRRQEGEARNFDESPKDDKTEEENSKCPVEVQAPVSAVVPFWNYFIIKFQYYILYTYAGLVKLQYEWLSGYAMTNLGNHWVFTPFRLVLGTAWTDLLIIHWFGMLFDLTVAFWLTHRRTRFMATLFAISFHLMNTRLFSIGMFPWVCLAHLPLFYSNDWPRRVFKWRWWQWGRRQETDLINPSSDKATMECAKERRIKTRAEEQKQRRTTIWLGFYIFLQLFLPNSHFITKGYNNWTKGLYGYSWNMMVNSWQPIMTSITVVDNLNNRTLYLEPDAFAENNRWTRHADMAKQYAECIRGNIQRQEGKDNQVEVDEEKKEMRITSENISIYFDIWCSMNSRFQQRVFDPRVDILTADWSPFQDTKWVLPILAELTELRPQLLDISEHVLGWNNYSDVLFIADYPGLALDNYITESADNVSLTILDGTVRYYETTNTSLEPVTLTRGQSMRVLKQRFHNILVLGDSPATYMYTYTNTTMANTVQTSTNSNPEKPLLPLWDETMERWNKFELFFQHVLNAILYEIYGVPMPRRVREVATMMQT